MARRPFFSGNYGSALGSFDTAAKLIAQAGQTQGQAMANIGAQVGGMIEQYGLNKQKKEELENKIRNRIRLDPSLAQRLTMTGDEDFDKKNFSDMDKLSKGELGLKGLRGLDSAMATVKEIDLQKQQEEDRNIKTKMSLALLNEQEDKNELKDRLENQRKASKNLVQEKAQGLLNRLLNLSGPERQKATSLLNPLQRKMISEYQLIKQGNFDPSDYMQSAEDALKMKIDMTEFEKLKGELEDQDRERTQAKEDERIKKDRYLALEGQLERIQKGLAEGRLTREKLSPDDSYVLSQEDNIRLRLPLGERPDVVEVLAERKEQEFKQEEREADKLRFDAEKTLASDPNVFQTRAGFLRKDPDGNVVRIGTPSENIGPVRLDKGEAIIQQGRKAAEEYDEKKEPLIAPTAAGGDVKGMLQDLTLYLAGKVGLSGKEVDEAGLGIGLGLEEREEQTARLTAINALIKPILVNAVNSRGPVYTQKNVDEDILANPKQDNPTVLRRLNEYPRFLQESLTEAESVLRDPEIKPGTETYEKARRIALSAPRLLVVINASLGGQINTEFSDPSIDRILGGASDNQSTKTIPVPTNPMGSFSKEDLLKKL